MLPLSKTVSDFLENVEMENNNLKREIEKLKSELSEIPILHLKLRFERIKCKILESIIEDKTDIKISNVIKESENCIDIYNFEEGSVQMIVHDAIKGNRKYVIKKQQPKKKKKPIYRSVKNKIELIEERPREVENKIKQVENSLEDIVSNVSVKETLESIDAEFIELDKNNFNKKRVKNIKELRWKLLQKVPLDRYIKIANTNVKRIEGLCFKKKYQRKKIVRIVSELLTPLDKRLIFYDSYFDTLLDTDDIQYFKQSLKVNMMHAYTKRYVTFDWTEFYERFYNYSIAIFTIKELLKLAIVNPYGFPNIVYLPLDKSEDDDPYSFYILDKITENGNRCWKMECRLDEFSSTVAEKLKTYCIDLFRRIYFDIFSDNTFRDNYQLSVPITSQDCMQLLSNIISLSKPKKFCNTIRTIIKDNCIIKPTTTDKFNLTGDDRMNRQHFLKIEDSEDNLLVSVKRMFDDISNEDAITLIKSI